MPKPGTIEKLNQLIEQAPFEVHVDRTFALEQVNEAHKALQKHFLGKLALRRSGAARRWIRLGGAYAEFSAYLPGAAAAGCNIASTDALASSSECLVQT